MDLMNKIMINKKTITITGMLFLLILIVLIIASGSDNKNGVGVSDDGPIAAEQIKDEVSIPLGSQISIVEVGNYMGSFVEDGSDEYVENVMSITVENSGEEFIQLAHIILNDKYQFELTTLYPGEKMLILEKDRAEYPKNMVIKSTEIKNVAVFNEEPSMHTNLLEIETKDGMFVINNVSGKTFPGGKVFYKNTVGDKLLGGITYAAAIPELKKGEGVQLGVNHFSKDSSRLMFVTYAE